ncbi:GNAT family N-acetyltransferase [Pelagicoccus sp. NFK12]|uniref:GNAT family N-acetyltransferase n=1 Tax=Pelagicoccus enzymogenes TaxID=2773457 RepID=A0A927F6A1_9BACT|nr:GNAT family N-acetyltransferase [Pelagicoccus enzymogenes]MBD5778780.1 GNAT family N-acetyltransferase [Pelagicoccus enzymogenes]
MPETQYVIVPLDPRRHDRESFICEELELNEYLKKRARKEAEAKTSTCFVITTESAPSSILGYYTLSNASIASTDLPQKFLKRLPRYERIPVTLLGRIARDVGTKGTDVGKMLMMSALEQSLKASKSAGSAALVLDPKNDKVASIYKSWGFERLENKQMFLPMKDIEKFIEVAT